MAASNIKYDQSSGGLGIASNGTTAATIYTFPSSLLSPNGASGPGGIIDMVRVYNHDTIVHDVELHLVPNGDAADVDTLIAKMRMAPEQIARFIGPERAPSQATLQIKLGAAHTTNPVYAKADVSLSVA